MVIPPGSWVNITHLLLDEKRSSLNTCSGMRTSIVEVLGVDAARAHEQSLVGPVELHRIALAGRVRAGLGGLGHGGYLHVRVSWIAHPFFTE